MKRNELDTPFLLIEEEILDRNIRLMQDFCDQMGYRFRPHIKTHKIPEIAHRQIAQGAAGITCQKLGEAEVMVDHGIRDILIYYNIIGKEKGKRLAALSKRASISVAIDTEDVASQLSEALVEQGGEEVGILIDCNTGYNRTGVDTPEQALALAKEIQALPRLKFLGLATFPYMESSAVWFEQTLQLFAENQIQVDTVSAGGSGFPKFSQVKVPFVTEYRAGTYVFNDRISVLSGWTSFDSCAERIVTTVISVTQEHLVMLDAGSKTLTSDTKNGIEGYAQIVEYPDAVIYQLSEEHGHADFSRCTQMPRVGDILTLIPNHACGAMNLHDEAALIQNNEVIGYWRVEARGKIR